MDDECRRQQYKDDEAEAIGREQDRTGGTKKQIRQRWREEQEELDDLRPSDYKNSGDTTDEDFDDSDDD